MSAMSLQERYDEVSMLSGLSEEVIRRVYKATRQSLAMSLKRGELATLPGICSITPEIRNRIDIGGESMTSYIKLKAKPSTALDSEIAKLDNFESEEEQKELQKKQEENLSRLNIIDKENTSFPAYKQPNPENIRTRQITALL